MNRWAFLGFILMGCGGMPAAVTTGERDDNDSLPASSLTELHAAAEPNAQGPDALAISTHVREGKLAVDVEVGADHRACTFGQTDGPSVRTMVLKSKVLSLDVDAQDAHAWLYGGSALECKGANDPLYAWTLLEPRVTAPKLGEIDLEDVGDPMLSEKDQYVVRLRASSFGAISRAAITIGADSYDGRIVSLDGEDARSGVVFDVPPEVWIKSALARESARLTASIDLKSGEGLREVSESIDLGLRAVVTEAATTPLED